MKQQFDFCIGWYMLRNLKGSANNVITTLSRYMY